MAVAATEEDARSSISRTFPVKPKLKNISASAESKYWRSFKASKENPVKALVSSITAVAFAPDAPHDFAVAHSATVTLFSSETLEQKAVITSPFKDIVSSASFRSDSGLLATGDHSGRVHVFDVKSRTALRRLNGHARPVHVVQYPRSDKLHLFSGGDDAVVKYWDVAMETSLSNLLGHKDYVRCGAASPVSDEMFISGSYDHTVRVWDIRVNSSTSAMEINHGNPVEDVIYLPSGGLIATAGGNTVKIWDVTGGGRLLHTMESHNKTVTSLCVAKIGKQGGDLANQYRILSVSLDGYLKVLDYAKFKITHSMRFPNPLLTVGVSPDSSTRVVGTSNGILYSGRRKSRIEDTVVGGALGEYGALPEPGRRALRPSYFRYFHRGQNEKPLESDYLVMRSKKVKVMEHDKLLKKFRHKEALVAVLRGKNPENTVAVMEELVARRRLMSCMSNLEVDELGMLLRFLQRFSGDPRFSGLCVGLARKAVEMRGEDVRGSKELLGHVRNLKRDVEEEVRIQQSMQEIQGIICPLLRIAARR